MYQYLEKFGRMTVFLSVKKKKKEKKRCKLAVGFETEDVVPIVHMTHFCLLGTGQDYKDKNNLVLFSASRGTL